MNNTLGIDWEAQQIFSQIADRINKPLSEIVRLHQYLVSNRAQISEHNTQEISSIILESSQQIQQLLEDILQVEQEKQIEILLKDKFQYPNLYKIDFDQINPEIDLLGNATTEKNRISKADLAWLRTLEQIVDANLDHPGLNLSWLSRQCAISERQLFRKLDKYTGLTPNKYIRSIRLHRAKVLLEQYACSTIAEVAIAVGMRDPYYFSKLYEEAFGVKVKSYFK